MTHDQLFSHAVTLAAGFIANGDIRLPRGNTRATSEAMNMIHDLIGNLYEKLEQFDAELLPQPPAQPEGA